MVAYNIETAEKDIQFQYPNTNDTMLAKLKRSSGTQIDVSKSEVENVKDLTGYSHSLFTHNGDNVPSAADPLTILKEAKAGKSFRCVEYSTLAVGLLWANGIPARTIGLKTSDVETREYGAGHVVIEFWSGESQKWIMCDVQAGVIPEYEDRLLSAYELRQHLYNNKSVVYIPITGSRFSPTSKYSDKENYSEWISEYLYFIDTPVHLTLGNEDKPKQQIAMLVPIDIEPPRMFQGMFVMNVLYTHSVLDFYPNM